MAFTLPIGIRIAAGLLGTTIDRIGKLPQELPTLGVSLAGQAVRTSFRVRQEIAELATRGDELLAGLTGRPQEKPAWATFDEDEDASDGPGPGTPVSSTPTASRTSAPTAFPAATPAPSPPATAVRSTRSPRPTRPARANTPATPVPVAMPSNRIRPSGGGAARTNSAKSSPVPVPVPVPVAAALPVTGDHLLSIAELKEELQDLDVAAVRELLVLEETGPHRAAYLTLLSNRLTTLAHENGQSETR